jgi:hypothetical protein
VPTLDLLRQRLHNQQLTRSRFTDPTALVAWLGAVQSQDYFGAKWALGQRLPGATDASHDQAFNAGAILRTHVLRPPWHFVAPADIRWLLALTGPRVLAISAPYFRANGLDAAVFKRTHAVITKALQGGRFLMRSELAAALTRAGLERSGLGLTYAVIEAELTGLICSGPRRGKQFTYALLDERVPPAPALSRDEALAELVRRYFTSHGPALVQDFVWWSGLTGADTKRGLDMLKSELINETVNGKSYWYAPASPPPIPAATYLLPNYDEYTVAYKERGDFYSADDVRQPLTRDNVPFGNMIVTKGRITGTWRRTLTKNAVTVDARYFQPPTPAQHSAFTAAAKRLGKFLDLPVVLAGH